MKKEKRQEKIIFCTPRGEQAPKLVKAGETHPGWRSKKQGRKAPNGGPHCGKKMLGKMFDAEGTKKAGARSLEMSGSNHQFQNRCKTATAPLIGDL